MERYKMMKELMDKEKFGDLCEEMKSLIRAETQRPFAENANGTFVGRLTSSIDQMRRFAQ